MTISRTILDAAQETRSNLLKVADSIEKLTPGTNALPPLQVERYWRNQHSVGNEER